MKYLAAAILVTACSTSSGSGSDQVPVPVPAPASSASASAAPADDLSTLTALANTAHKSLFPDADAYVALDRDDITLAADGSTTTRHKSIVKILDAQRGKEKFADVHIPFDSTHQTLTLLTARTVNADGVAHAASPDEISDIVPPQLADATIYADARERVVTFPAVDTGSVVELEYTRTTKPSADAPGGGELALARWNPIGSRVVTITVPVTATPPKLAVLGTDLAPSETTATADGTRTYTFAIANLPDRHAEAGSAPDATTLPRLVYSFADSWKSALAPVADRFLAAAVPAKPTAAIQQQADALVAAIPATDPAARAAALYAFVAHDVRSIELPLGLAGYEPHAPDVVLANRYGDARDKVGLLLALAAAEGISGTPVFVRTHNVRVEPSVPTLAQFDHIIGKLAIAGKDTWLDPSNGDGRYGVAPAGQDNLVLPIVRGGAELGARAPLSPDTSTSHTTAVLALAGDGSLDAHYTYQLTGQFATDATEALRPLAGENLARYFQRAAGNVAAGAIDADHEVGDLSNVTGALRIAHHVTAPGYAAAEGAVRVVELPAPSLDAASIAPMTGMSARTTPLLVGTPTTQTSDVTLEIPAGWRVSYVPPEQTGSADGVAFSDRCSAAGQIVTCHREIKVDALEIASARYGAFRDTFAQLSAYARRIVVLQKV